MPSTRSTKSAAATSCRRWRARPSSFSTACSARGRRWPRCDPRFSPQATTTSSAWATPPRAAASHDHARSLESVVRSLEGITEINFVAHSLGNLVVRHWLKDRANADQELPAGQIVRPHGDARAAEPPAADGDQADPRLARPVRRRRGGRAAGHRLGGPGTKARDAAISSSASSPAARVTTAATIRSSRATTTASSRSKARGCRVPATSAGCRCCTAFSWTTNRCRSSRCVSSPMAISKATRRGNRCRFWMRDAGYWNRALESSRACQPCASPASTTAPFASASRWPIPKSASPAPFENYTAATRPSTPNTLPRSPTKNRSAGSSSACPYISTAARARNRAKPGRLANGSARPRACRWSISTSDSRPPRPTRAGNGQPHEKEKAGPPRPARRANHAHGVPRIRRSWPRLARRH